VHHGRAFAHPQRTFPCLGRAIIQPGLFWRVRAVGDLSALNRRLFLSFPAYRTGIIKYGRTRLHRGCCQRRVAPSQTRSATLVLRLAASSLSDTSITRYWFSEQRHEVTSPSARCANCRGLTHLIEGCDRPTPTMRSLISKRRKRGTTSSSLHS